MPIKVQCTCGRAFTVAEKEAGGKAFCPVCGVQNLVPEPDKGGAVRVVLGILAVVAVAGISWVTVRHFKKHHDSTAGPAGQGPSRFRVADNPGGVSPSHGNGPTNPSHPQPSTGGPDDTPTHPIDGPPTDPGHKSVLTPAEKASRLQSAAQNWLVGLPARSADKRLRFTADIQRLTGGSEDERVKVIEEWTREGDKEAGALIRLLLEDDSPKVRLAALKAAIVLDPHLASDALENLPQDSDLSTRVLAIIVAGLGDDPRAAQAIRPLLSDAKLRPIAMEALGILRDKDSSPEIAKGLTDPDPFVQAAAYFAMGRLGTFPERFPFDALRGSDALDRCEAAIAAGEVREVSLLTSITQMLQDRDAPVRRASAEALGLMGQASSEQALLPLLRDPNAGVRYEVARSLGHLRSRGAMAAILPMLDDQAKASGVSDIEAVSTMLETAQDLNLQIEMPQVSIAVREGALRAIEEVSGQRFEGKTLDEKVAQVKQWWAHAQVEYPR